MIKRTEIDSIIDFLNTKTDVTDIVDDRIYWGLPVTEPTEIYITVQEVVNKLLSNWLENTSTIEIRIISWNDKNKWKDVQALDNLIVNYISNNTTYWTFEVYKILPLNGVSLYTEDNRKEYVRDYQINFIN